MGNFADKAESLVESANSSNDSNKKGTPPAIGRYPLSPKAPAKNKGRQKKDDSTRVL
jgi:hypothetical protein